MLLVDTSMMLSMKTVLKDPNFDFGIKIFNTLEFVVFLF